MSLTGGGGRRTKAYGGFHEHMRSGNIVGIAYHSSNNHLGILRAFLAAIIVTPKCSSHLSSGQPHTKRPSSGQDLPRIPHWAEQPSGRKEGGGRVCIIKKKSIRVSPVLRAVPCAVFWDLENDGLFIRRPRRNKRVSAQETPRRPPRTPKLSSHLL